jgi:hypothetical protein
MSPLVFVVLLVACASATLQFDTRSAAVSAMTQTIAADYALRLALSKGATGTAALSAAAMDFLLVDRLHVIQDASAPAVADVRTRYVDDAASLAPLVVYGSGANVTAASSSDVSDLKYAVLVYATMLSDDPLCPDVNQVPVENPLTGKLACGCADGRVCGEAASPALVTSVIGVGSLPNTAAIVVFVLAGAGVAVIIVFLALLLKEQQQKKNVI